MMRCSKSTYSSTRSLTVAFPCTCCGELTLWCSAVAFSLSLMDSMNPGPSTLSCHRGDVSLIAMTENTHKRKSLSCYHSPLAGGFAVVTVTPSLVIWILTTTEVSRERDLQINGHNSCCHVTTGLSWKKRCFAFTKEELFLVGDLNNTCQIESSATLCLKEYTVHGSGRYAFDDGDVFIHRLFWEEEKWNSTYS